MTGKLKTRTRGKPMPRVDAFDSTRALLREGYDFIGNRCRLLDSDIFVTRLMLRKAICLRGADAAEMFYGSSFLTRSGAMPQVTLRLLQDKGSVQLLDGPQHKHRKAMFLAILLDEQRIADLVRLFRKAWHEALREWQRKKQVILFDAVNLILTRAVSEWMGIPDGKNRDALCRELVGMIENAGSFGPRAWVALLRRRRTERYVAKLVTQIRDGRVPVPENSPFNMIASYLGPDSLPLPQDQAAVEAINIMRPVVAVGRYVVFAAMALDAHPRWHEVITSGDDSMLEPFVEEVRRLYPFFPFVGGRSRKSFDWNGYQFRKGDWILLDLYGTNHDVRSFPNPEQFDPERAPTWKNLGYDFIPQGAGDPARTHRCPGEAITVALIMEAVRLMTSAIKYDVPKQDLSISMSRVPALPRSGFRITNVRERA